MYISLVLRSHNSNSAVSCSCLVFFESVDWLHENEYQLGYSMLLSKVNVLTDVQPVKSQRRPWSFNYNDNATLTCPVRYRIGQSISKHTLPTAKKSNFLFYAFVVHSTSFLQHSSNTKWHLTWNVNRILRACKSVFFLIDSFFLIKWHRIIGRSVCVEI